MSATRGEKVKHVKGAKQTRDHVCHWPGCGKQCKPAMWGCYPCWMKLPREIRERIWNAYKPGQEKTMRPSESYLEAADAAQKWIAAHYPATASARPKIQSDDPKAEVGSLGRAAPARPPAVKVAPVRVQRGEVRTRLLQLGLHFATRKSEVMPMNELVIAEHAERSAIREYLGGISRRDAELYALEDTVEYLNARFATQ